MENQLGLTRQKNSLTPKQNRVLLANKTKKIETESDGEIKKTLLWIFAYIGLKEMPDNTQALILVNYIKNNLYKFTLSEMRFAFELAIQNILDIGLEKIEHYQGFSPMYLERIMQSYKRYSFDELRKNEANQLPEKTEPTLEEQDVIMRKGIKDFFEKYKQSKNTELDNCFIDTKFRWLWKKKYIVISKEQADKTKEQAKIEWKKYLTECRDKAVEDGSESKHYNEILNDFEKRCVGKSGVLVIRSFSQKLALFEWFDKLIKENIDISDILK
jgi:hypothetical protein